MPNQSLPTLPKGLTADWLSRVLHEHGVLAPEATVTALRVEQVGEGVGMMSELSRVVPVYDGVAGAAQAPPASLIAKYPSQVATNRDVAMSLQLYEREVRYFAELDRLTSAHSPTTYLVAQEGDNFVILMEDLADYAVGDQIIGATLQQTELAIDELAKLHAAFWDRVTDIDWIPNVSGSDFATTLTAAAHTGWDAMCESFGDLLPAHLVARHTELLDSIPALKAYMARPPITLAHGDFRMENLLYGTRPEHPALAIIDWQGPMLARGMLDVTLLLGQSTQTAVRRTHERALLQRYLDGLADLGVEGYEFTEAWQDYRYAHLHSWTYAIVVAGTLDASNERAFRWMSQMIARQVAVTEDLELLELLPGLAAG